MSMIKRNEPRFKGEFTRTNNVNHFKNRLALQESEAMSEARANAMGTHSRMYSPEKTMITERHLRENALLDNAISKYNHLLEMCLFKVTEKLYMDALPLDEDYKELHKEDFKKFLVENLSKEGSAKDILAKMEKSNEFLAEAAKDIKKFAKVNSKAKENDDTVDSSEINLASSPSIEEASSIVKEKVMKVLKDENEHAAREEDLAKEFNDMKAMNENVSLFQKGGIPSYSLFKSMMINNYKRALCEARELNESTAYVTFSSKNEATVNMDMILAESVINYTLLELCNTIGYKTFNSTEVRKMSEKLAFGKL